MRRILALTVTAMALVSCLGKTVYSDQFTSFATFEFSNNYGEMFGSDSLFVEQTFKVGFTWTNYLAFGHKVNEASGEFEGGFMVSYLSVPESGNTELLENNNYRASQTCVSPQKNTFVVFSETESMPERHFWFNYTQGEITGTCMPKSVRVNNSVGVINALKENFQDGDRMTLKVAGYLDGKHTGSAEVRLAEFGSPKDSIITTWTVLDLSPVGVVDKIDFDIEIPEGRDVPKVVCMDDFIVNLSFTTK